MCVLCSVRALFVRGKAQSHSSTTVIERQASNEKNAVTNLYFIQTIAFVFFPPPSSVGRTALPCDVWEEIVIFLVFSHLFAGVLYSD